MKCPHKVKKSSFDTAWRLMKASAEDDERDEEWVGGSSVYHQTRHPAIAGMKKRGKIDPLALIMTTDLPRNLSRGKKTRPHNDVPVKE